MSARSTAVPGHYGSRPLNEGEFNAFVRHDAGHGEIYRVDDIKIRDGQLQTTDGRAIEPTETFISDPVAPVERIQRERSERSP